MDTNANKDNLAYVNIDSIYLDPNNYRLVNSTHYFYINNELDYINPVVQKRTMSIICGDKDEEISDLITSFRENGYLYVDYIQVREIRTNVYVVLEGNRRIAALKRLKELYEKYGYDLKNLEYSFFKKIPVRIEPNTNNMTGNFTLMALKHINGNKKWGEWNQALFLADLRYKYNISEDEICNKTGITKNVLRPTLRAYRLVKQFELSDYSDQYKENMFPMFKETVRNARLKEWLSWNDNNFVAENKNNLETLFSLMSKIEPDENNYVENINSNNSNDKPPLTKREDIRKLGEFIKDESALNLLIKTRNLDIAYNKSIAIADLKLESVVSDLISASQSVLRIRLNEKAARDVSKVCDELYKLLDETKFEFDSKDLNFSHSINNSIKLINIELKKFKRFNNKKLENCSLVNIIAGENNSGKTSLLEAIYLLIKQNDIQSLLKLIKVRGKNNDKYRDYDWVSKQIFNFNVCGKTFESNNVEIELNITDSDDYKEDNLIIGFYKATQNSISRILNFKINANDIDEGKGERFKSLGSVEFSSPFYYGGDKNKFKDYYSKAMENKLMAKIVNFINEHIVNTIETIYWDESVSRFKVQDKRQKKAIDLCKYGEGFQRIFHIALLFANNQNGVVLIDEFENAIHASLLRPFAEFICRLSKEFNVQLFLTSHSKECIDSFSRVNNLEVTKSFYGLKRKTVCNEDDETDIFYLSSKYFEDMLNFMNIDLRLAN